MKKYRRIEITAFRRRTGILSGRSTTTATDEKIIIFDADTEETIELEPDGVEQVVIEAVRLLEMQVPDK